MSVSDKTTIDLKDLPLKIVCKYLGSEQAKGLWGVKHTRNPVDNLVTHAKNLSINDVLPLVNLVISKDGISATNITKTSKKNKKPSNIEHFDKLTFKVDEISYGVQDMIYTRVFCMIVVTGTGENMECMSFVCHAFVCESSSEARRITLALASVFEEFGKELKQKSDTGEMRLKSKKFVIDLRSPEEQNDENLPEETEA